MIFPYPSDIPKACDAKLTGDNITGDVCNLCPQFKVIIQSMVPGEPVLFVPEQVFLSAKEGRLVKCWSANTGYSTYPVSNNNCFLLIKTFIHGKLSCHLAIGCCKVSNTLVSYHSQTEIMSFLREYPVVALIKYQLQNSSHMQFAFCNCGTVIRTDQWYIIDKSSRIFILIKCIIVK